jgi:hypothetical protein
MPAVLLENSKKEGRTLSSRKILEVEKKPFRKRG